MWNCKNRNGVLRHRFIYIRKECGIHILEKILLAPTEWTRKRKVEFQTEPEKHVIVGKRPIIGKRPIFFPLSVGSNPVNKISPKRIRKVYYN